MFVMITLFNYLCRRNYCLGMITTNLQIIHCAMNKRQRAVYELLSKNPKVKAYGFTKKELKGLAATIAENLDSAEDASDEDVNAEIENAVEAVLPALELGRTYANRVINSSKNVNEENNDGDGDGANQKPKPNNPPTSKEEKPDNEPAWFKAYRESMEKKFAELTGDRIADQRKSKLEKLLKDTGKFGERMLKNYARMSFPDDDAFDEFLSEVEEDLKSENQDRANKGLEKLGAPATGGGYKKQDEKPKVLSEDEVKALAKM